jgi:hypothetical protein
MRTYKAFYKGKTTVLQAESSYAAQELAAKVFKATKSYQVAIVLLDTVIDTASI